MSANRAEVESVLRCEGVRKNPLFMPAIYEHKGFFIDETPSNISRDADLFTRAVLAEFEAIGPDALTIGVDVYNLEAEAAGCQVTFYEGADTSIPGIRPGNHVITQGSNLSQRPIPNPLVDGRMPINIETARRVVREFGESLWVRGAISGPFSLAISLMGAEDLFLCCIDDPDFTKRLLEYSSEVIKAFGKAYIDVGAEIILFDSQASTDLLSPKMYRDFVVPYTKEIVAYFKEQGIEDVPLIIGGNTTRIVDLLIETGANNLLCDFTADWPTWSEKCRQEKRSVRRNINPRFIEISTPDEIYAFSKKIVAEDADLPGFIMGTAVIPFGTPTENIRAVRSACRETG